MARWVVGVARGAAEVERVSVWLGELRSSREPLRQVRVGDVQLAVRDQIGVAVLDPCGPGPGGEAAGRDDRLGEQRPEKPAA